MSTQTTSKHLPVDARSVAPVDARSVTPVGARPVAPADARAEIVGALNRRRRGSALLVVMLLLVSLAFLGMSTLETVMSDRQSSGFHARKTVAFHAADGGIATVHAQLDGVTTPVIPITSLGDANLYPHGQPSFGPDPNGGAAVQDLGAIAPQGMNLRIGGGEARYQVQYWRFQVQGTGPGGSTSRIELAAGVLRGN